MPRFHFPIIDGTRLDDPLGIELPDAEEARKHAHRIASNMPTKNVRHVSVIDENGEEVHKVPVNGED